MAIGRLVLAAFLVVGAHSLLLGALPIYLARQGAGPLLVGVAVGAYAISAGLLRLLAGSWLDRRSTGPLLRCAALLFATAHLGFAVLPVGWGLLAPRLVQGIAVFLFYTASQAWLVRCGAPEEKGRRLGLFTAVSGLALILMPAVGVAVLDSLGAQTLFLLCAGAALLSGLLAVEGRPEPADSAPASMRDLLPAFAPLVLAGVTLGSLEAFLPAIAQRQGVSSLPPVYLAFGLALALGRLLGGASSDRLGRQPVALLGSLLMCVAFGLASEVRGALAVSAIALVYGLGVGGLGTASLVGVSDRAGRARQGQALALAAFCLDLGLALGAASSGLLALARPGGMLWLMRWAALLALISSALLGSPAARPMPAAQPS